MGRHSLRLFLIAAFLNKEKLTFRHVSGPQISGGASP